MFENRVLRRIFGSKRNEGTEEWRRIHNKELNDLYHSPNFIRVIKYRRMRWVGHVARMGERNDMYRVLVGKLRERGHLEDQGVDRRIILKRMFKRWNRGMYWIDMAQDRDSWQALVNAVMNLLVP